MVEFRTAPSFFLLGRGKNPNTVKWSLKDRILALAVMRLEKEKCPHCGVPIWHGQTADSRVEFALEWAVCYGCVEKAELTKDIKSKDGEWAHIHAVDEDGGTAGLPTRAEGLGNIARPLYSGTGGASTPRQIGPGSLSE